LGATLALKCAPVSENSRPRYAGVVIIVIVIFGLLILASARSDTQIIGSVFLVLGALVVWSIVRASRQRQWWEEVNGRLGAVEQQLGTRLRKLEEEVAKLSVAVAARPAVAPGTGAPVAPDAAKPASAPPVPSAVSPVHPTVPAPTPAAATPAAPTVRPGQPPAAPPAAASIHSAPGSLSAAMRPPASAHPAELPQKPRMRLPDIEEALGTNWLSKLGITGLVLGVSFFLVYEMNTMGPAGKVLIGYLSGAALLAAGLYFERLEQYRRLARVGIAGGWPLLFFVTYAMYHVSAAKIAGLSLEADLVLMLIVAGAMVAHTLRYRSQMITGLALLLAFLTITVNREGGVWSLTASVVLAMAVAVLSVRMEWYELEVFGILATYLNHFWWLVPVIEPMGRPLKPFPEFTASIAFLLLYWTVFRASYVMRAPPADENVSSVAGILNPFLLLALAKYQSVYPELAWKFLLLLGGVEFVLGQLPIVRRRRAAFIVLSTIGVTLIFTAMPLHFSPDNTSLLWVALAESLFFSGVFLREIVFRRLGYLASAAAAIQLIGVHAAGVYGERMDHATYALHLPLGFACAIAAAAFFFTAHVAPRIWPAMFEERWDAYACEVLSWLAGGVAFAGVYVALPYAWIAVVWMALGALLLGAAKRWNEHWLAPQACAAVSLALLRALVVNLQLAPSAPTPTGGHEVSLRLLTLAAIAILCYLGSRWGESKERAWTQHLPAALSWAGTGVFTLLAWYELQPASVALAWALLAVALLETGIWKKWLSLRVQAYGLCLAAFFRIFFVNLNGASDAGFFSPRVYTVVPMAVVFYFVYERLQGSREDFLDVDRRLHVADLHSWLGLVTALALLRFEVPLDWVVAAWAALAVLLLFVAAQSGRRLFLSQGLVTALAVAVRGTLHNFYERSYFPMPAPFAFGRYLVLSVTAAILLAGLPLAYRMRARGAKGAPEGRVRRGWFHFTNRPEQTFFFVALALVTALLAAELRHGMVTMAWGLEAVVVFLFALKVGERSFRLAGLALLLLCVAKITLVDIWGMGLRDRALTFVVLGASMLGVSVLYTKHRDLLRQYL